MSWVNVTTAVGTAGAAVVALGLGLRGIFLDHRRARDEELRQARLVVVSEPFPLGYTPEGELPIAVKVWNYSDAPIRQVELGIDIWRTRASDRPADDGDGIEVAFLEPGGELEEVFNISGAFDGFTGTLRFMDAAGRRFKTVTYQTEPQRVLHPPVFAVRIVDGRPAVVEQKYRGPVRKPFYRLITSRFDKSLQLYRESLAVKDEGQDEALS